MQTIQHLGACTLRGIEIPLQIDDSSPMAQMSDHVWRVPQSVVTSAVTHTAAEG